MKIFPNKFCLEKFHLDNQKNLECWTGKISVDRKIGDNYQLDFKRWQAIINKFLPLWRWFIHWQTDNRCMDLFIQIDWLMINGTWYIASFRIFSWKFILFLHGNLKMITKKKTMITHLRRQMSLFVVFFRNFESNWIKIFNFFPSSSSSLDCNWFDNHHYYIGWVFSGLQFVNSFKWKGNQAWLNTNGQSGKCVCFVLWVKIIIIINYLMCVMCVWENQIIHHL